MTQSCVQRHSRAAMSTSSNTVQRRCEVLLEQRAAAVQEIAHGRQVRWQFVRQLDVTIKSRRDKQFEDGDTMAGNLRRHRKRQHYESDCCARDNVIRHSRTLSGRRDSAVTSPSAISTGTMTTSLKDKNIRHYDDGA